VPSANGPRARNKVRQSEKCASDGRENAMDKPQGTEVTIGDKTVYLEEGWYTLDELQAYVDNVKRIEAANPRKEESNEDDKELF
jgi:hypothetical protein